MREFFQSSAIFIVIAVFLFIPYTASAEAVYQWRHAMSWPDKPILHNAAARFARNVEVMSSGRMRIIVDAPGRHKAPLGLFDMVRSGAYEMGHTASYYYKGKDFRNDLLHNCAIWHDANRNECLVLLWWGLELLNEVYARHNIVAFPAGNTHHPDGGVI